MIAGNAARAAFLLLLLVACDTSVQARQQTMGTSKQVAVASLHAAVAGTMSLLQVSDEERTTDLMVHHLTRLSSSIRRAVSAGVFKTDKDHPLRAKMAEHFEKSGVKAQFMSFLQVRSTDDGEDEAEEMLGSFQNAIGSVEKMSTDGPDGSDFVWVSVIGFLNGVLFGMFDMADSLLGDPDCASDVRAVKRAMVKMMESVGALGDDLFEGDHWLALGGSFIDLVVAFVSVLTCPMLSGIWFLLGAFIGLCALFALTGFGLLFELMMVAVGLVMALPFFGGVIAKVWRNTIGCKGACTSENNLRMLEGVCEFLGGLVGLWFLSGIRHFASLKGLSISSLRSGTKIPKLGNAHYDEAVFQGKMLLQRAWSFLNRLFGRAKARLDGDLLPGKPLSQVDSNVEHITSALRAAAQKADDAKALADDAARAADDAARQADDAAKSVVAADETAQQTARHVDDAKQQTQAQQQATGDADAAVQQASQQVDEASSAVGKLDDKLKNAEAQQVNVGTPEEIATRVKGMRASAEKALAEMDEHLKFLRDQVAKAKRSGNKDDLAKWSSKLDDAQKEWDEMMAMMQRLAENTPHTNFNIGGVDFLSYRMRQLFKGMREYNSKVSGTVRKQADNIKEASYNAYAGAQNSGGSVSIPRASGRGSVNFKARYSRDTGTAGHRLAARDMLAQARKWVHKYDDVPEGLLSELKQVDDLIAQAKNIKNKELSEYMQWTLLGERRAQAWRLQNDCWQGAVRASDEAAYGFARSKDAMVGGENAFKLTTDFLHKQYKLLKGQVDDMDAQIKALSKSMRTRGAQQRGPALKDLRTERTQWVNKSAARKDMLTKAQDMFRKARADAAAAQSKVDDLVAQLDEHTRALGEARKAADDAAASADGAAAQSGAAAKTLEEQMAVVKKLEADLQSAKAAQAAEQAKHLDAMQHEGKSIADLAHDLFHFAMVAKKLSKPLGVYNKYGDYSFMGLTDFTAGPLPATHFYEVRLGIVGKVTEVVRDGAFVEQPGWEGLPLTYAVIKYGHHYLTTPVSVGDGTWNVNLVLQTNTLKYPVKMFVYNLAEELANGVDTCDSIDRLAEEGEGELVGVLDLDLHSFEEVTEEHRTSTFGTFDCTLRNEGGSPEEVCSQQRMLKMQGNVFRNYAADVEDNVLGAEDTLIMLKPEERKAVQRDAAEMFTRMNTFDWEGEEEFILTVLRRWCTDWLHTHSLVAAFDSVLAEKHEPMAAGEDDGLQTNLEWWIKDVLPNATQEKRATDILYKFYDIQMPIGEELPNFPATQAEADAQAEAQVEGESATPPTDDAEQFNEEGEELMSTEEPNMSVAPQEAADAEGQVPAEEAGMSVAPAVESVGVAEPNMSVAPEAEEEEEAEPLMSVAEDTPASEETTEGTPEAE